MSDRPILFNGEMVRAILAGTKTQTRRPVVLEDFKASDTTGCDFAYRDKRSLWDDVTTARLIEKRCPFGMPGDTLWVRETWRPVMGGWASWIEYPDGSSTPASQVAFAAMGEMKRIAVRMSGRSEKGEAVHSEAWHPSIHMPRWASRLSLRVTDVRVQRVQDISEADAQSEGCESRKALYRPMFTCTWDDIYGDKASWQANPWVWAVSFERVQS